MVYNSDEFLAGMRDCHVVMLTFATFFSQILGKGIIPTTDKLCGVEKGVAQVSGAAFLHVRIG